MDSNSSDSQYVQLVVNSDTWTNENTIEFLQLIQTEPSIWDPNHRHFNNRIRRNDAWIRIKDSFSLPCTLKELKRKRNCLMTTYRDNLKRLLDYRIKEKGRISVGSEYKPCWFAFEAMHKYLGPVYSRDIENDSELESENERSYESDTYMIDVTNEGQRSSPESTMSSYSGQQNRKLHYHNPTKRRKSSTEEYMVEESVPATVNGECDLYGQLLAEKLKVLEEDDRLHLMNEIDNLVFKYKMKIIKDRPQK